MSRIDPLTRGTPGGVPGGGRFQNIDIFDAGGSATICAGPFLLSQSGIKRFSLATTAIPCQVERPCPSSLLREPRLRSLTAPRRAETLRDALKCHWMSGTSSTPLKRHPREGGDPVTFAFKITGKSGNHLQNQKLDPRLEHSGMTIAGAALRATGNRHFSVSDDWSTATPGPIVELIETFCR